MAKRTPLTGSLMSVLVLFSTQVAALPFASIEPQSFAMGGAGVASASNSSAVFLNPALLAINAKREHVELAVPLGYRLADKEKMLDALSYYKDNSLEATYDAVLNDFKNGIYINNNPVVSRQAIAAAGQALGRQLTLMRNKQVQSELLAGVVVAVPDQKVNMSLSVIGKVLGGARVDVTDTDLTELQRVIDAAADASLLSNESFDSTRFTSTMLGRGLVINEIGLSLAREIKIAGHDLAIGITPKYLDVTSFDYVTRVNSGDFKTNLGQKNHSAFDLDIGVAKHYDNGWGVGLSVKNLVGQEYTTVLGNKIEIKPQMRIGASHATKWTRTVLDLDLNESKSLGFDSKTQYLAIGSELNVFDMLSIRIGYRHNLADTATSMATTGFGWQVFGGELDLAVGANEDEVAYTAQYGFQF